MFEFAFFASLAATHSTAFTNGRRCLGATFVTGDPLPVAGKQRQIFIDSIDVVRDEAGSPVAYIYIQGKVQLVQVTENLPPRNREQLGLDAEYSNHDRWSVVPFKPGVFAGFSREQCTTGLVSQTKPSVDFSEVALFGR